MLQIDPFAKPEQLGRFWRIFASSTNSATVLAGKSAFTASIIAIVMTPGTGAKSAFGS
jgi:hypothetical protein